MHLTTALSIEEKHYLCFEPQQHMKKLFTEFKSPDYETWLNQIKKDLKDKPLDALISNPEKDIEIKAYYHPEKNNYKGTENTFANNFKRESNEWKIRKIYSSNANKKILTDLNEGVDAISLEGNDQKQFDADTKEILFDFIGSDIRFGIKSSAISLQVPKQSYLNFDIVSLNAKNGEWNNSLDDFFEFYQSNPNNKNIWVDGNLYGDSGASTIQELAFTIAHLNEYIQFLKDKKVDLKTINKKIVIELSVNENYFVNIAKFRVIRELISLLFSGYDSKLEIQSPSIFAKTSHRFLATNDHNNNLLRETTQAMSAVLGGCDALTITHLNSTNAEDQELNERMAKNTQLVLREESYFAKVNDAAAGSYYVEELTNQLLEKSWKLFLEIENNGGLISSLKNNFIQSLIDENKKDLIDKMLNGKQTFLGVNKFQSKLEKWIEPKKSNEEQKSSFKKLSVFRLENSYEQKNVIA